MHGGIRLVSRYLKPNNMKIDRVVAEKREVSVPG